MDFAILWIFCLSFFLLIVAFSLSLAAGFKKRLWQYLISGLPTGAILIFLFGITVLLWVLRTDNIKPLWLFPYALSMTLFYIIGIIIVFRWGMKKENTTSLAGKWPKCRLAFFSGLLVCFTIGSYLYMDLKVLIELAKIRAESAAKIQNQLPPRLPDHLNAAGLYERAGEGIKIQTGEKRPEWFYQAEPAAYKPLSAEAFELKERYKHTLAIVRKASTLPGYYFEMDITDLISSPIPNYMKFRDFSKLLVLSAQEKVITGDITGAMQELDVIRRMALHIRDTPTLIAAMISGVLDKLYISGMEYVLAYAEDIPDQFIDVSIVPEDNTISMIYRSFQMESLFGLQILSTLDHSIDMDLLFGRDFEVSTILLKLMGIRFWRVFFARDEISSHRQFWESMLERISASPDKKKIDWQDWMKEWEAEPKGLLAVMFLPNFSQYVIKAEKFVALRRLGNMAMAAEAFRKNFNRYPNHPEELVPDYLETVPTDPFDGKPLKLKTIDNGVDLFSVGPDKKDAGEKSQLLGPIHFYLGREVYRKYRLEPIKAQEEKKAQKKKRK